jgi:CheY-like chemotaxis protein
MEILAGETDVNLILLDLNLPDCEGFAVLAELRERYPAIAIVVLSAIQERAKVFQHPLQRLRDRPEEIDALFASPRKRPIR